MGHVAWKYDYTMRGAGIISLRVELAARLARCPIEEHILKQIIVVVESNAGAQNTSACFAGVPRETKLRREIQVGLTNTTAERRNSSKVIEQIPGAGAWRQSTEAACR